MTQARFAAVAVLLIRAAFAVAADPPTVEAVLRENAIDPRDVGVRLSDLRFMIGERPRSSAVDLLISEPLRAEGMASSLADNLASAADKPGEIGRLLLQLSYLNSRPLYRALVGDPLEKQRTLAAEPDGLEQVLRSLDAPEADLARCAELPESVRRSAAFVLAVQRDALDWAARAMSAGDDEFWEQLAARLKEPLLTAADEERWEKEHSDADFDIELKYVIENFDTPFILRAAQDVFLATSEAVRVLRADSSLSSARFDVTVRTSIGLVVLAGAQDHRHQHDRAVALLIDVGGNDRYTRAGANRDRYHPLCVAIDLAGDDEYKAPEEDSGAFGSGVLGVGILWDDAGDDLYDAPRRGLGSAYCGVGMLVDNAGKDRYRSIDASQASATCGFALLLDRAGDDTYESHRCSQGFAGPNAVAALVDLAGDDRYVANDSDVRFPSPQDAKHNISLSQGAATGWRADYTDGVSVCGGVGVLYDRAGSDEYSCGLFGQGAGYWHAAGLLIDGQGDDKYAGVWYVQGAAAHYAAGVLLDRDGNDRYTATHNMAMGAGHDLSSGVLVDRAGNDVYRAPTLSLGASNAAGVGIFIDRGGDDDYATPKESTLGWFNACDGFRANYRAIGLFLDLGGADRYAGRESAKDRSTWLMPDARNTPTQFGVAVDLP